MGIEAWLWDMVTALIWATVLLGLFLIGVKAVIEYFKPTPKTVKFTITDEVIKDE